MAKLRLQAVLQRKKLSKRQFSKLLKMQYSGVFRYFRPNYDPKLSTLTMWAKTLGVRVRDLIEE